MPLLEGQGRSRCACRQLVSPISHLGPDATTMGHPMARSSAQPDHGEERRHVFRENGGGRPMTQVYVSMGRFPDEYFAGTIDYIARVQQNDGAIPWFEGGPHGPLGPYRKRNGADHRRQVRRSKAGLLLAEEQPASQRQLARRLQGRQGGRWHPRGSNFVAYVATGVWHYFLVTGDMDFLHVMWPTISTAMAFVLRLQGDKGQIHWCEDTTLGIREDSLGNRMQQYL